MSKKYKVLLVEDLPLVQSIHTRMLQDVGCNVDIAANGTQALTMISGNNYEIIFMDIGLPDISGIEVVRRIRKNGLKCPIVALTAFMKNKIKDECIDAGIDEIETKPISIDKLSKIIHTLSP